MEVTRSGIRPSLCVSAWALSSMNVPAGSPVGGMRAQGRPHGSRPCAWSSPVDDMDQLQLHTSPVSKTGAIHTRNILQHYRRPTHTATPNSTHLLLRLTPLGRRRCGLDPDRPLPAPCLTTVSPQRLPHHPLRMLEPVSQVVHLPPKPPQLYRMRMAVHAHSRPALPLARQLGSTRPRPLAVTHAL
jgi:hypothetical protein